MIFILIKHVKLGTVSDSSRNDQNFFYKKLFNNQMY